jgi:hypothetical protein
MVSIYIKLSQLAERAKLPEGITFCEVCLLTLFFFLVPIRKLKVGRSAQQIAHN